MKKKAFDCVEMKRQGARRVLAETAGMTFEEEITYWQERSEAYRRWQRSAQEGTCRMPPSLRRKGGCR